MNMENFYPVTLEMEERAEEITHRYGVYTSTHFEEMGKLTLDQRMEVGNYVMDQEDITIEELNKLTPMEILENIMC